MTETLDLSAEASEAEDRAGQRCLPVLQDAVSTVVREIVAGLA